MRAARLASLAVVILATMLVASASALPSAPAPAPKGLHGFLLRPNEPVVHSFSRTPAFAWAPVRGASCYEFELATSRTFDGSSIVWSNVAQGTRSGAHCRPVKVTMPVTPTEASSSSSGSGSGSSGESSSSGSSTTQQTTTTTIAAIKIPAVSINLVLPWFTGKPYSLYAHVRAVTPRGPSKWSRAHGFNMRWEEIPVPMASRPGLVRWTPVSGATSYDVWFTGPYFSKVLRTHTNVADLRELYTFHLDDEWWRLLTWRVRAVRQVAGSIPNGLPVVSYGPWTNEYTSQNPVWSSGKIKLASAVSDRISSSKKDGPHQLMPALTFTGDEAFDGQSYRLFRFYVFTDKDCVNTVFRSSVVGGPAFAPRLTGPLKLPTDQTELDYALENALQSAKTEDAKTFTVEGLPLTSNEVVPEEGALRHIDLPDLDATTTRYYWTVVPVVIRVNEETGEFEYFDNELPQDACQAGRIGSFGKESRPAITTSGTPYVSGLTPKGRLLAQASRSPVVYSTPLIAWRPVVGATAYEIQWSKAKYPWRVRGKRQTHATSTVLNLSPGLWYYRVRGLNGAQIGTPAMTWSAPVPVRVAKPTFKITNR